jgi:hypothetical protein
MAESTRKWAEPRREARDLALVAYDLGVSSARIARTDGAISGTPFYVALVPGYLNYLWQETRMTLRLAALYGRDPGAVRTSAEPLWLRGMHPSVDAAEAELLAVRATPLPPKPQRRRPLRLWFRAVRRLLVFGGFLSPPREQSHSRLRLVLAVLIGAGGWVLTAVFPLTLMALMAWSCESNARRLFREATVFYSGASPRRWREAHDVRRLPRSAGLAITIGAPIAFIAYADHIRNVKGLSLNPITGLGALVAISLVIAMAVLGARR